MAIEVITNYFLYKVLLHKPQSKARLLEKY